MNKTLHYFLLKLISKPTRCKNLFILQPTSTSIHKGAIFDIKEALIINKPWVGLRNSHSIVDIRCNAKVTADRFKFYSCDIQIRENAKLYLGAASSMNDGGRIVCLDSISIGNDTIIAHDVTIRDSDSHTIIGHTSTAPVNIGNHVWIGERSIILKGVSIGDGSVIGAGSVVTKDIPPRCLAVGNPARVIRHDVEWTRKLIDGN